MPQPVDISGLVNSIAQIGDTNRWLYQREQERKAFNRERRERNRANKAGVTSMFSGVGSLAGGVVGGYVGGPVGAGIGAGLGQAGGSILGGLVTGTGPNSQDVQSGLMGAGQSYIQGLQQQQALGQKQDQQNAMASLLSGDGGLTSNRIAQEQVGINNANQVPFTEGLQSGIGRAQEANQQLQPFRDSLAQLNQTQEQLAQLPVAQQAQVAELLQKQGETKQATPFNVNVNGKLFATVPQSGISEAVARAKAEMPNADVRVNTVSAEAAPSDSKESVIDRGARWKEQIASVAQGITDPKQAALAKKISGMSADQVGRLPDSALTAFIDPKIMASEKPASGGSSNIQPFDVESQNGRLLSTAVSIDEARRIEQENPGSIIRKTPTTTQGLTTKTPQAVIAEQTEIAREIYPEVDVQSFKPNTDGAEVARQQLIRDTAIKANREVERLKPTSPSAPRNLTAEADVYESAAETLFTTGDPKLITQSEKFNNKAKALRDQHSKDLQSEFRRTAKELGKNPDDLTADDISLIDKRIAEKKESAKLSTTEKQLALKNDAVLDKKFTVNEIGEMNKSYGLNVKVGDSLRTLIGVEAKPQDIETTAAIRTAAAEAERVMEALGRVRKYYKPEYVGPVNGPRLIAKMATGVGLTPNEALFAKAVNSVVNAKIKQVTGAAMSNQESIRIIGEAMKLVNPAVSFEAGMDNIEAGMRESIRLAQNTGSSKENIRIINANRAKDLTVDSIKGMSQEELRKIDGTALSEDQMEAFLQRIGVQ